MGVPRAVLFDLDDTLIQETAAVEEAFLVAELPEKLEADLA